MSSENSDKIKNSSSEKENKRRFSRPALVGLILILISFLIPLKTFSPVIKSEIDYQLHQKNYSTEITPVNTEFSLVIPKINTNTKVIQNIDPFNSQIYQKVLTQGVAHASTSDTPDQDGNVFIFAHSAGNWYQANQYNAVFYLLNKLNSGDQIFLYYHNQKYVYSVTQTKIVDSDTTDYLKNDFGQHQLTLMTCWPPGTTLKRLIIVAQLQHDQTFSPSPTPSTNQ